MVNWTDPVEEGREIQAFIRVALACFGLYVWELFETCGFEWSIITRRRRCSWHLVFFFICRYCMLSSLVGLIVSASVTKRINCAPLYTFNAMVGNLSIMTASTVLMIRTIVMWERNLTISAVLGAVGLAHWALLWRAMFIIRVAWEAESSTCTVIYTNQVFLRATFYFTMAFDLLILILAALRIFKRTGDFNVRALLLDEGLIFFLVAGICNIVPAVLSSLNLNPVMNIISTIPASVISAIAACRTVVQLPEVQSDLFIHVSTVMNDNTTVHHIHTQRRTIPPTAASAIQVNTERFVMEDMHSAFETKASSKQQL